MHDDRRASASTSRLAARGALRCRPARRCAAHGGDPGARRGSAGRRNRCRADRRGWRQRRDDRGRRCRPRDSSSSAIRSIRRGARRWTALPAEIGRANGLYRAVGVAAGPPRDTVSLPATRPRGRSNISGMTALTLARPSASRSAPDAERAAALAGFTLVELMIVMAIVGIMLAIAFAQLPRHAGARERVVGAGLDALHRRRAVELRADVRQSEIRADARRRWGSRCPRPARRFSAPI